jgi:hypothetical protein
MSHADTPTIRQRRKLPARYSAIVTPLFISILMSCIVSGISTLNGVGLISGFVNVWMQAWGTSWRCCHVNVPEVAGSMIRA